MHAANGKPLNRSRMNAAVQDMAIAKSSGQQVYIHGAQDDRGLARRAALEYCDTQMKEERQSCKNMEVNQHARLCLSEL